MVGLTEEHRNNKNPDQNIKKGGYSLVFPFLHFIFSVSSLNNECKATRTLFLILTELYQREKGLVNLS